MNERRPALERPRLLGCLLSAAMIGAPFLALLYGQAAGLAVAAGALATTAYLAWDAARPATNASRKRLLVAAAVNLALAALCVGALVLGFAR